MFLLSIFIEVIYQIARVNPCDNLSTNSSEIGSHRRGSPISIVLILTDVVPTDVVLLSVLYWSHSSNCTGKPMWQFINHLFQCTPPKWVLGHLFSYEAMSLKTLTSRHWSRLRSHSSLSMLISYRCHPFYKCCTSKNILHVHPFCPVSCSFKTTPETGFVVISTDQQRLFLFSYEAMSLKTLNTQDRCLEVVEVALIFYRCLTAIDIIMFLFSYKRIALLWGLCHWRHSTSRHWSHWRSHSCAPMLNSYRCHTNSRAVQAHCHG